MRTEFRSRVALLAFAFGLPGCTGAVYWPNIAHAPMLAEKGEAQLSAHGSPIQLQGSVAYAVTDHIAVRAQGDGRVSFTSADEGNTSFDAGIGWFTAEAKERGWRLGVAVDAGVGEVRNANRRVNNDATDEEADSPKAFIVDRYETGYRRVSAQVEAGMQEEGFLVGGVLRVSSLTGTLEHTSSIYDPETEDVSWTLVEPIGILRMRIRHGLAFEVQLGGSIPASGLGPVAEAGVVWPFVGAVGLVGEF